MCMKELHGNSTEIMKVPFEDDLENSEPDKS